MTNRYLREIDLMRRGTGEGALDLDMINRDGFDAMQVSEAIAKAAGGLGRLVAEYSQEGCGIAIIDKGDDVSIIGVYHAKDIAALPAAPPAATLEAALELPEIKALVDALVSIDALDPEYSRIDGFSENALRGLVLRMGETSRAALAALQTKEGA